MKNIEKALQNQITKIDLKLEKIRIQYLYDCKKNEDGDYTGELYFKIEKNERILNSIKENLVSSLKQIKYYK